eukprot:3090545-Rhodomonas_salina.1
MSRFLLCRCRQGCALSTPSDVLGEQGLEGGAVDYVAPAPSAVPVWRGLDLEVAVGVANCEDSLLALGGSHLGHDS